MAPENLSTAPAEHKPQPAPASAIPADYPLCDNPICDAFGLPLQPFRHVYRCIDCDLTAPRTQRRPPCRTIRANRYFAKVQAMELKEASHV